MTQKAKNIMTLNPACCKDTDTLYDAVKVMADRNCGVVPIVDANNQCIGIVTDRDICLRAILNQLNPEITPISKIMSRHVLTCYVEDDLHDVILDMEQRRIRRIPVVDQLGRCVGVISQADIATQDENVNEIAELVEALSY